MAKRIIDVDSSDRFYKVIVEDNGFQSDIWTSIFVESYEVCNISENRALFKRRPNKNLGYQMSMERVSIDPYGKETTFHI